jgi:diaminohydroxyphosphoribosylaminopyrimidine deaminase / 5-amino-6-(5-phosphoribosylamino)uracil reductase
MAPSGACALPRVPRPSPSHEPRFAVDEAYMRRALELAERGRGLVAPNPLVGAVIARDGETLGEGWHEGPGTRHAEIVALDAAGERARGATLYVNLEPCSHFGRTPPCAPRLVEAGVARVVAGMVDPNPLVEGRGVHILRDGGIAVHIGVLEHEATRLNEAFAKHIRTGLPLVTLKMAASLDGRAAARDGSSRWITGGEARADVHRMRAAADAILVGAGTAVRDDPALTCRDPDYRGPPKLRVIIDGRGILPETHRVFDGEAPVLVATTEAAPEDRRRAWRQAGAIVLVLEEGSSLVPLERLFAELGKRDVQHVLVEGGPTLAWELVERGLVDRVVLFLAPKLIGGKEAPGILEGEGVTSIAEALPFDVEEVARVGPDIKVVGRVHGDR